MSEAAAQSRPPSRRTAQSSPIGTSTSGGACGTSPEILRMISNSFTSWARSRRPFLEREVLASADRSRARIHLRSCRQRPHRVPQGVRLLPGVPGRQAAPLLLRGPEMGVVRGAIGPYLPSRMSRQKTDPGVELGIVGSPPGLDPGPPGCRRLSVKGRLLEGLAAGAGDEVFARLEHPTRVLPEPHRRLATSQ